MNSVTGFVCGSGHGMRFRVIHPAPEVEFKFWNEVCSLLLDVVSGNILLLSVLVSMSGNTFLHQVQISVSGNSCASYY